MTLRDSGFRPSVTANPGEGCVLVGPILPVSSVDLLPHPSMGESGSV